MSATSETLQGVGRVNSKNNKIKKKEQLRERVYIDKSRCASSALLSEAVLWRFTGLASVGVPSKNISSLHSGTKCFSLVFTSSPVSQVPVMSPLSQVSMKQPDDTKDLRT